MMPESMQRNPVEAKCLQVWKNIPLRFPELVTNTLCPKNSFGCSTHSLSHLISLQVKVLHVRRYNKQMCLSHNSECSTASSVQQSIIESKDQINPAAGKPTSL